MATLTDEQILALLSTGTTRGLYKTELSNFINSGEKGMQIDLTEGVFAGREPATVKQGFENAKNGKNPPAGAEHVVLKKVGEKGKEQVFLINTALVTAR